jgi:hypothetical protein
MRSPWFVRPQHNFFVAGMITRSERNRQGGVSWAARFFPQLLQLQMIRLLVRHLLVADIHTNHLLVPTYGRNGWLFAHNLQIRKFRSLPP